MVEQKQKSYTTKTPMGHEVTVIHLSREDVERELAKLEAKYGMTSAEFLAKGRRGELECSDDFFEWEGHCAYMYEVCGVKELEVKYHNVQELIIE